MFTQSVLNGSCTCGQWKVNVKLDKPMGDLNPRVCDCDYCRTHPSAIVSDPSMKIDFTGGESTFDQNGDRLAKYFYCNDCGDLLAVGCHIDGKFRGAVSSGLFDGSYRFGEPVKIQPWRLSSKERLERWGNLWGSLKGIK